MNTEQVQGTNDSSIVSKLSMVNQGYFHDPFIKHFVEKPSRRTPLINRCYFARAAAISYCVERFLTCGDSEKQIVSLGAGFDTTFFRTKEKDLVKNAYFVEVDFPDVIKRKIALAKKGGVFTNDQINECQEKKRTVYKMNGYCAIGYDLQQVGLDFQKLLISIGVDLEKPTLFLSEVVLTYLPSKKSSKVIKWVAETFKNAVFTVFEQVSPSDSFGRVMMKHFKQIGSPLLTINDFPTIAEHVSRHSSRGFGVSSATSLDRFYYQCIDEETRKKIECLEIFDEFEAWHRACQHYFILCSTNSILQELQRFVKNIFGEPSLLKSHQPLVEATVKINHQSTSASLIQRYGHCSCVITVEECEYALVIGGFGIPANGSSHQRLHNSIAVVNMQSHDINHCQCEIDSSLTLAHPMFASCVRTKLQKVLIFGGRSAPKKYTNTITELFISKNQAGQWLYKVKILLNSCHGGTPLPRWRHSAVLLSTKDGIENMVVYGGRDADSVLGDCWSYNVADEEWRNVLLSGVKVLPRHSASICSRDERACFLSGGLGEDEVPFNDIYKIEFLNPLEAVVSRVMLPIPLPAIYSHSSQWHDELLFLIGGVAFYQDSQYGDEGPRDMINLIDLKLLKRATISLTESNSPILLHNHSSVISRDRKELVILGGGDNCFSFGTWFTKTPLSVGIASFTNVIL